MIPTLCRRTRLETTCLPKMMLAIIAGVFMVFSPPAFADTNEPFPQFSVTGTGSVSQPPDMATITMGVVHQADTAAAALGEMRRASAAVFEALAAFEIATEDQQTSQLKLSPQWESYKRSSGGDARRIAGYVASNMLTVRVRDLTWLGAVMDAVADSGANEFRGLTFGFADPEPLMDEARSAAMADARRKARGMARATDVTLGRVLSMREGGRGPQPEAFAMAAEVARSAMPVASGEVSMTATFTITYEILNEKQ